MSLAGLKSFRRLEGLNTEFIAGLPAKNTSMLECEYSSSKAPLLLELYPFSERSLMRLGAAVELARKYITRNLSSLSLQTSSGSFGSLSITFLTH